MRWCRRKTLEACPACRIEQVRCRGELPPRYARLFDDVPIPSAYLSATAGVAGERDGRIVVYGLTASEGMQACEMLKQGIAQEYRGELFAPCSLRSLRQAVYQSMPGMPMSSRNPGRERRHQAEGFGRRVGSARFSARELDQHGHRVGGIVVVVDHERAQLAQGGGRCLGGRHDG